MRKSTTKNQSEGGDATALANIAPVLEQRLGPIEYRPLGELRAYANNPRKHPKRQITQLMASIGEFGFTLPLLVATDGTLICGHARLEAAAALGVTTVPVIVARFWSKAQEQAYRLADNRLSELGSWDPDLLRIEIASVVELGEVSVELMGWSTGEVDVILDSVDGTEKDPVDAVPPLPETPVSRLHDVWILGAHRLLNASSLEAESWAQLMNGKVAALSLNDPPWNVRVNGHVSSTGRHAEFAMASGEMTFEEFIAFNASWLKHTVAHVKDGAIVMAFMDHHHLFELMSAGREVGLKHLNLCVWAKTNGGMGSLYRSQHELVLVLKHGSAPHTNMVELGRHGRYRTNIWTQAGANAFGSTRDADLAAHPTVKPVALLAEAIRDVTRHGEIVVDAFSGSGSTILACERTKRVGYAIEIAPGYVDVAIQRWEAMTGGSAVLEATGRTYAEMKAERAEPLVTQA